MLVCEKICKSYYLGDTRVDALKNINLEIRKGEFVAIIGQSGSGKSTLMNILGCLDRQSQGEFYIGGKNVGKLSSQALSQVRAREIG
ncbi:MAG: ATP-binding cassette domain-containing protein, partial [Oscillospiraceae bacterium]|nr:ATP-binding cassette domain-containing protein [Oscillospiraceae bacterium]